MIKSIIVRLGHGLHWIARPLIEINESLERINNSCDRHIKNGNGKLRFRRKKKGNNKPNG